MADTARVSSTVSSNRRSWVTSSRVPSYDVERLLRAARWRAGRGGWWARRAPGSSRPARRSGRARPGCARRARACPPTRSTCSAPSPNFASSERASATSSPVAARNASSSDSEPANAGARLVHLAHDDAGAHPPLPGRERQAAEEREQQRRLAAAVGADDGHALAPADLEVDRAEGNEPRCTTAPCRRITTSPLRAALATWNRRSQPSHGFSTASRRAIAFSVARAFAACFSDVATRKCRMNLSFSEGRASRRACPAPPTRVASAPAARAGTARPGTTRSPPRRGAGPWPGRRGTPPNRRRTRSPTGCARRARAPA